MDAAATSMTQTVTIEVLRQHLIDPEICIRCNTCEETCPVDAITHDSRNYVVDPAICNGCNDCISPCPTGAIDNWRRVLRAKPYTLDEQLLWDTLPSPQELGSASSDNADMPADVVELTTEAQSGQGGPAPPPWSAAHPYINVYTIPAPAIATVSG